MSVEKYILSKDESGFTILSNVVLQNYTDIEGLGLWSYLASKPTSWVFYKDQLRKHFTIGRERLQKILKSLCDHGLITITSVRSESGKFAHANVHVHSGAHFKIIKKPIQDAASKESVQPHTGKPSTVNQSPVTDSYKERCTKKEDQKKDQKILSASDDAHEQSDKLFDEFWEINIVKKNKRRAKTIWDKKKLYRKATLICDYIKNSIKNDQQWQDPQYIPHPDTILRNERWTDEITHKAASKPKKGGNTSFSDFINSPTNSGATYDEHGNAINPFN